MRLTTVKLNNNENAHASMLINMDFITRIDINTNFVVLIDGLELILTNDSMVNLLTNCRRVK